MRTSFALALALSLVAAPLRTEGEAPQDPPQQDPDWATVVEQAVGHPRFAVRRAATGRLVAAGDAAIPALVAYQREHGRDAVPLELVDALGRATGGGPATVALLTDWAADPRFFWRSQALGGLARRAVGAAEPLFAAAVGDPSHLQRIEGVAGLLALDPAASGDPAARPGRRAAAVLLATHPDPRARLRVALLLLERGDPTGVPEVLATILDRAGAVWLDDPFGAREAVFAVRELRRLGAGDFRGALAEPGDEREQGRAAVLGWAATQGVGGAPAAAAAVAEPDWVGGLEIRSCRLGDLFLRWTADGTVSEGLGAGWRGTLDRAVDPERFAALRESLHAFPGTAVHGQVICDYLRVLDPLRGEPRAHHKCAPGAVPAELQRWLRDLAGALGDHPLRSRLPQFVE
ncbi:MAG: hypothetical protein IPM29_30040 [Planctomycetes bacterium]|nr:hypothetical protein [Planctomycetota bacterium]